MEGATQTVNVVNETAHEARLAVVEAHFTAMSDLMQLAETLAGQMLSSLATRLKQGDTVYPGELIQICRGLHVLAKCGLELRRQLGRTGKDGEPGGISEAQIDRLEARLRPLFAQRAA